jgi:hypothetical protein
MTMLIGLERAGPKSFKNGSKNQLRISSWAPEPSSAGTRRHGCSFRAMHVPNLGNPATAILVRFEATNSTYKDLSPALFPNRFTK